MVVASGWWVAIVQLTPAADRPYIGGSQDNSILNLIFGYNGFGRLTGNETGSVGGAGTAGSMWGPTGLDPSVQRELRRPDLVAPAGRVDPAGRRSRVHACGAARTDRTRAALILWGGSLVVTALVFSLAAGIIHPYYTVALAPAIGALVGIGSVLLWRERSQRGHGSCSPVPSPPRASGRPCCSSAARDSLRARRSVAALGIGAAIAILGMPLLHRASRRRGRRRAGRAFAGPAAYTIDTVLTPHSGAIPSAGPAVTAATRRRPRRLPGRGGPGFRAASARRLRRRRLPGRFGGGFGSGATRRRRLRRGGGFLNASTPGAALVTLLRATPASYSWVAATIDANSAAGLPARDRRSDHGDRRLQRHRSRTEPRAVRAVRRPGPHPLLHRIRRRTAGGDRQWHVEPDRDSGSSSTSPPPPSTA